MGEIIASTYEIIKEIGSGGGGIVYLARHLRLKKKVVLKADKRRITTRTDLLRREVDILKELNHTYIPQVYDYFIVNDTVYTVIDYVEGESLDKALKRGEKFSQVQVIEWAKEILEALDYLHRPIHGSPPRGYVHSDIKPANIMRRPNNDICLIDFNIALALGEENAVGRSQGYASPEHYGLDFSSDGSGLTGARRTPERSGTELLPTSKQRGGSSRYGSVSGNHSSGSGGRKGVKPDVRSDIYSLGATLYHLLSGQRPAKGAKEVIPLSGKEFSPQIVDIISKAMNPNPDLRYQTAREMLDAFLSLHRNDRRTIRWRRRDRVMYASLTVLMAVGTAAAFAGLKRMQTVERWMRLTEDAKNHYQEGNSALALQNIMQVYGEQGGLIAPEPPPGTQEALTEILGVYDLADDFKVHKTVELPAAPLDLQIAPDGTTAVCICDGNLEVIDLERGEIVADFPAENSALAEVEYLDNSTIVYAGKEGIAEYDLLEEREVWRGEKTTGIAVSGDGSTVAAVYKDDDHAVIYDAATGEIRYRVDFGRKGQRVTVNDIFINPSDNLFCLNKDGSKLAVSFADGSLEVIELDAKAPGDKIIIFDDTVDYVHYEGGFYRQYLAFSANNGTPEESVFSVIDTESVTQAGGFQSEGYYFADADETGIIVGVDNVLVRMEPVSGEEQPLVTTDKRILQYSHDSGGTVIATEGQVSFFDEQSNEICSMERKESCDVLAMREGTAVIGSLNSQVLWIMKYETCPETEIAAYAPEYPHDEVRLSGDAQTLMLFSYDKFRICDLEGNIIKDVELPNGEEVYDQQFVRDGSESYLEVIYNSGLIDRYDASDGELMGSEEGKAPDPTLYEEFETSRFRVESPLHGVPRVYDKNSGKLIGEWNEEGYLTYISELGDYLVVQYMTTDNKFYGYLMNQECQILAFLPNLCDVLPDALLFDYPTGSVRKAKIYELSELQEIARTKLREENRNEN